MTGFAHANEISAAAIARAGETLSLLDPARRRWPRPCAHQPPPLHRCLAARRDGVCRQGRAARTIDAAARARDPRVAQVSVSLSASWSWWKSCAPMPKRSPTSARWCGSISIVAEQNGRRESGHFGMGGRYLYDDLFEPETWNRGIDGAGAGAGQP
jgi:TldD protein